MTIHYPSAGVESPKRKPQWDTITHPDISSTSANATEQISCTVAMNGWFENPWNSPKYQQESLRLFPTIRNMIRRAIESWTKFCHNEIPLSEMPNNDHLSRFYDNIELERNRMLSLLKEISWKISELEPWKKVVIIASDDCFTNSSLIWLLKDFLWEEEFDKYFSYVQLSYDRDHDDEVLDQQIHNDSLVLCWWSWDDTYAINPNNYDWRLSREMRSATSDNRLGSNVHFLNVCFSHQLFWNNVWILNRDWSNVVATIKWPAQFTVSPCDILPLRHESATIRSALKYLTPDIDKWGSVSIGFTRTWYQYYDLFWSWDVEKSRSMWIVPLAIDRMTWTIVIAASHNCKVITIQPHPEIDIVDPTNVMKEIWQVAHYLTDLYWTDWSIVDNYSLKNPDWTPFIKHNSGLPFYVWTINALLEDILEKINLREVSNPELDVNIDSVKSLEDKLWHPLVLPNTAENISGFIEHISTFWLLSKLPSMKAVGSRLLSWLFKLMIGKFSAGNIKPEKIRSDLINFIKDNWFGNIKNLASLFDDIFVAALKYDYFKYKNNLRLEQLDKQWKISTLDQNYKVSQSIEDLSKNAWISDFLWLIKSHKKLLKSNWLLSDLYTFCELNSASGSIIEQLDDKLLWLDNGYLSYWVSENVYLDVQKILVESDLAAVLSQLLINILRKLSEKDLNGLWLSKKSVREFVIPAITEQSIIDYIFPIISKDIAEQLASSKWGTIKKNFLSAIESLKFNWSRSVFINSSSTGFEYMYPTFHKYDLPNFFHLLLNEGAVLVIKKELEKPFYNLFKWDVSKTIIWTHNNIALDKSNFKLVSNTWRRLNSNEYIQSIRKMISDESFPWTVILDTTITKKETYIPRINELFQIQQEFRDTLDIFVVVDEKSNVIKSAILIDKAIVPEFDIKQFINPEFEYKHVDEVYLNPYFRLQSLTRKYISSNFKYEWIFETLNVNNQIDQAISSLLDEFINWLWCRFESNEWFYLETDWDSRVLFKWKVSEEEWEVIMEKIGAFDKSRIDHYIDILLRDYYDKVFNIVNKLVIKINSLILIKECAMMLDLWDIDYKEVEYRLAGVVDEYFSLKDNLSWVSLSDIDIHKSPALFYDKLWWDATNPKQVYWFNIDNKFLLMIIEKVFNGIIPPDKVFELAYMIKDIDTEKYFIYNTVSREEFYDFSEDIWENIAEIMKWDIKINWGFDIENRPIEEMVREQLLKWIPSSLHALVIKSLYNNRDLIFNKEFLDRLIDERRKEKMKSMEHFTREMEKNTWLKWTVSGDWRSIVLGKW